MFEMMTPLEETVSGKELIAKGEKRGLAKAEGVLQRMLQEGSISPEKYQQALQALIEV